MALLLQMHLLMFLDEFGFLVSQQTLQIYPQILNFPCLFLHYKYLFTSIVNPFLLLTSLYQYPDFLIVLFCVTKSTEINP